MKVELLVNLKMADGRIISAGTIFSDENGPIPESIMRRVARRTAKIIDYSTPPSIKKDPTAEVSKVTTASPKKVALDTSKPKRVLKKKE